MSIKSRRCSASVLVIGSSKPLRGRWLPVDRLLFDQDLQLAGYAKRSIQSYVGAVLRLQRFYNKNLENITQEDLRQYWLCWQSRFGWSTATLPLEIIFKAKFKAAMKKAHLLNQIDPAVWKQRWVIDSQAVGRGQYSLRYLSRYVFRVAISNQRIKTIENHVIKFLYKDREKRKWKTMALDAMEFIRWFLQHVLPKGFMKIRHYGFLNPNCAVSIEKIRELISFIHDVIALLTKPPESERPAIQCGRCGHDLKFVCFVKPASRWGPG